MMVELKSNEVPVWDAAATIQRAIPAVWIPREFWKPVPRNFRDWKFVACRDY